MKKNHNKKLVCFIPVLIIMFCIATSCTFSKENTEVSEMSVSSNTSTESNVSHTVNKNGPREHGYLRVEQGKLTDENGSAFQLRGMSTHGIGWYPNYINAGAMGSISEAGGNVIRVAMYTQADSGYLSDPERNTNLMLQAIENARAMNLYVIVDWHNLDDGDPNTNLDKAITFFDGIASRYQDDPSIIYEICNEPNNVSWSSITQYAYAICPVIRQYSPKAVIILGTPDYSFEIDDPLDEPFSGENILYAYHFYAGLHKDYSVFRSVVDKGLPVIVSEWGIDKDTSGQPALENGQKFVSYLNEKGISWCAWSLCNKDEVHSVLRSDCNKLSGWEESDLTDVGKIVFAGMGGKTK